MAIQPANLDFSGLLQRLRLAGIDAPMSLVEAPGRSSGFLPILPPRNGRCAILFYGIDPAQVRAARQWVEDALGSAMMVGGGSRDFQVKGSTASP